jgi:hypothetical protein
MFITDPLRFPVLLLLRTEKSFRSVGAKVCRIFPRGRTGRTIYTPILENKCLVCHFENLGAVRPCVYLRRVELVLGTARA